MTERLADSEPVGTVPYLMKCGTPDCDSIVVVTEPADYAGWSFLEDPSDLHLEQMQEREAGST